MKTLKAYSRRIDAFDEALRNYARSNALQYAQSRACTVVDRLIKVFKKTDASGRHAQIAAVKKHPELFPDSASEFRALERDFFVDLWHAHRELAISELYTAATSLCMQSLAKKAEPNIRSFVGRFVEEYRKKRAARAQKDNEQLLFV